MQASPARSITTAVQPPNGDKQRTSLDSMTAMVGIQAVGWSATYLPQEKIPTLTPTILPAQKPAKSGLKNRIFTKITPRATLVAFIRLTEKYYFFCIFSLA